MEQDLIDQELLIRHSSMLEEGETYYIEFHNFYYYYYICSRRIVEDNQSEFLQKYNGIYRFIRIKNKHFMFNSEFNDIELELIDSNKEAIHFNILLDDIIIDGVPVNYSRTCLVYGPIEQTEYVLK